MLVSRVCVGVRYAFICLYVCMICRHIHCVMCAYVGEVCLYMLIICVSICLCDVCLYIVEFRECYGMVVCMLMRRGCVR